MPKSLKPLPVKLIKVGRKLEAPFSARLRKQMNAQGMMTYKISDRFRAGIPDIYAAGGIWIESKIIPRMPSKLIPPIRYFSGPQRVELNRLTEHGDQCFAALYFAFDAANYAFALVPWWEFQRIAVWDIDTIMSLGIAIHHHSNPDFKMERYFDGKHALKFDSTIWWDGAFKEWERRNPEKFDEFKVQGLSARVLPRHAEDIVATDDDWEGMEQDV